MRRSCFISLLSVTICTWSCLAVMVLGGTDLARDMALRGAGFQKQEDLEAYWSGQPTPIPEYKPAELRAVAPPPANSAPPQPQIVIQVNESQQSFSRNNAPPPAQAASAPVAPEPVMQLRTDEQYNEFMTITKAANGDPLVVYRAQEEDFLRLCDFTWECQGDYYRYQYTDLHPGGAIFHMSVNVLGNWQDVGIIALVDGNNHLALGGIIIDGAVYSIPSNHPLHGEIDNAMVRLNYELDNLQVTLDDRQLHLDAIQITENELIVVFR